MGKVYINRDGKYLYLGEVSSHGTERVYHHDWGELNDATLFPQHQNLKKFKLKDGMARIEPVGEIPAEETRIVTLVCQPSE